jgi:hypothetical protein
VVPRPAPPGACPRAPAAGSGRATATAGYLNHFLSERRFSWTSQNKMTRANNAGRKVLEHARIGLAPELARRTSGVLAVSNAPRESQTAPG